MMLGTAILFLGVASYAGIAQSPGTFTATGAMIMPRAAHTATLLPNGKVLITGGTGGTVFGPPTATAELFDPSTGAFTPTGNMTTPRASHSATLLADGRVLIVGGVPIVGGGPAELYDPSTGSFTPVGTAIPIPILIAVMTLADGRVLVEGCANPCNSVIAGFYDPADGTFKDAGPQFAGGGLEVVLADGKVLIVGGCPANHVGTKAQVFDPSTGLFSPVGLMTNGCEDSNTATLLLNGKVLFVGSDEYPFPADASLFDPMSGTFANVGPAIAPREFSAATLIPDGTVFITGGQLPGGNGQAVSELYTPASSTFSVAGNMVTARHQHTATLLPDGTVLIAGGFSLWPSSTASAELYRPAVLVSAPLLFSLSAEGKGQGAIWHATTGQAASPDAPAFAGEILSMYTTGLADGSVIPPRVAIGGRLAEVLFFGSAPGYPDYNQVNFRVPSGIAPRDAVPVRLTYLGRPSNEVTIGVR